MDISGNWFIDAAPRQVVAALYDPGILATCIPKCHDMAGTRAEGFTFEIRHNIGPVAISLPGRILLTEQVAEKAYDMTFSGTSLLTGTVGADATLTLAAERTGTKLTYKVSSQPSRLFGMIGEERIRQMMQVGVEVFLARLTSRLGA